MKVLIQNYRTIDIYFCTIFKRFYYKLETPTTKQNFEDCIKGINLFYTKNSKFERFKAQHIDGEPIIEIVAITKDNLFVCLPKNNEKIKLPDYLEDDFVVLQEANKKFFDKIKISQNEINKHLKIIEQEKVKILSQTKTLQQIKSNYAQPK